MAERTFRVVLQELADGAQSPAEKGQSFERLVKAFLEQDKQRAAQFAKVWPWADYPHNRGMHDVGIDLVAEERDTGHHVAIQCKFYAPGTQVDLADVNQLLGAYARPRYASGILISTSDNWTRHAENALEGLEKPVQRWGPEVFENSSIDWQDFRHDRPSVLTKRDTKQMRDYQQAALDDVLAGFAGGDRGKLIMACGSGKTFTALRIAELVAGAGGAVLFLTPSISLLGQSLIDWANDADLPLKPLAVCSDIKAGKRRDDEDISPYDLVETPSTNPAQLAARFEAAPNGHMKAVFSTYQSLGVIHDAQRLEDGLPEFDLIICDEAHRTTGASLAGKDESNFQLVHRNNFIAAQKRLYMTATPRIYKDQIKRKAAEKEVTLASMDDEAAYGPEFHCLGFGRAIELGILSDYKVVVLHVDQEQVGSDLHALLSDSNSKINMDNGARMVGCWNGLGKHSGPGLDFTADPAPAKRAVAFSNTIAQSQNFGQYFSQVIETCINADTGNTGNRLTCQVKHVDGTQNALARSEMLSWLREGPAADVCRVLTNARCLTEGIDVPALDAILFLHPRKSDIDVVQAVGRVMRKSEGKNFGYVILPVALPENADPQSALNDTAYKAIWQVINAIKAHDDRFEAQINQLALAAAAAKTARDWPKEGCIAEPRAGYTTDEMQAIQGRLMIAGSPELRDAILARVVDKYADPKYWERWAADLRQIAERHESRIRALIGNPDLEVGGIFDDFLKGIQASLNDGITREDAIGMLSQHLITKPVFDALFADYAFSELNPVSQAMQGMLDTLEQYGLEKETAGLEGFYRDVRLRAAGVNSAQAKTQIIADLYERFLKLALPETAARLGIVYTPVPVVDYILRSVEDVLQAEFGLSVSDEGVHIIDPFVGTGTFITRLLQSGLIKPADLPRKYAHELHANDIMPLAYYVAAINIEAAYHDQAQATEYQPFPGIVLTDTFQSAEPGGPMDEVLFPQQGRIDRQKKLDIRVIIGNPPWSATNNRAYPNIARRVQETYAEPSRALKLSALYDPYVKAVRLASDRVRQSQNGGIVAFVTNAGFIDSNAFDGFRKAVADEFDSVYCYNLRGNALGAGEPRKREGGNVFGGGSKAGVGIMLLVKKPGQSAGATIRYRDIGDCLSRDDKLTVLNNGQLTNTDWQIITPNSAVDWIGQRSQSFAGFYSLSANAAAAGGLPPIFEVQTLGLVTSRDAWCYNSSLPKLQSNIQRSVNFYNGQVAEFIESNPVGSLAERQAQAKSFATKNPGKFHWSRENYRDLANGETYAVNDSGFTVSAYRPFFKQRLYFDPQLNNSVRIFPELFPNPKGANLGISLTGLGSNSPFHALMTDSIAEYCLTAVNSIYIPRYRYVPATGLTRLPDKDNPELERVSNINPQALAQFRAHYGDAEISEDDLFYYTYGALHSPQYRAVFADDLSKVAARIPMAATPADFRAFAAAGRELAGLHIHYESVEPYPLEEVCAPGWNANAPHAYRVEKMRFAGPQNSPDRTRIIYNAGITLAGIPEAAHQYRLGSRSALEWALERYRITTHKESGIVNDPNDWAAEQGQPRYILDLLKRLTAVSVRTVAIVAGLPELPI